MENLDDVIKKIDKNKIKSIKIEWKKVLEDRAFQQITVKLFKEKKDGKQ
jgi:hypothetical protein